MDHLRVGDASVADGQMSVLLQHQSVRPLSPYFGLSR